MSVKLADLVTQLKLTVPVVGGVPADAQYQQAIRDAVLDYGNRCPVTKQTTIQVNVGTAEYALPDDFVRVSLFPSLKNLAQGNILITGSGIVPLNTRYTERVAFRNGQMTIYPVPLYTMTRLLIYAAGFPYVTGDDAFTDLDVNESAIAMHKAAEFILIQLANGVARQGWRYSLADESVDKTQLASGLSAQAKVEHDQYESMIAARAGAQAMQADYNQMEYGSFSSDV